MTTDGSGAPGNARREWAIRLAVATLASAIVAVLGPFSTYELYSFPQRLLYWGGVIFALVLPAVFIRSLVHRYVSGSPLRRDLIAALVLSAMIGSTVWTLNLYVMGFDVIGAVAFAEHVGVAALICMVPVCVRAYLRLHLTELQTETEPGAPLSQITEAQAVFLRRLEPEARGYVLRVSADDHQVEVWTDRGSTKLRLRFGDALKELTDFDGTRIHRSHWVAFCQIEAVVPDGRRHLVHLTGGVQLPVSQSGLRALEEAGVRVSERPATRVNQT